MFLDTSEIVLRLAVATASGLLIGVNRDSREKPAGMRTLALVALGAALTTLAAASAVDMNAHPDAASRVLQGAIQGVIAGIGFVGAGAILHRSAKNEVVHGVTTAATVFVSAALGLGSGIGAWRPVAVTVALVFVILLVAKPLEAWMMRRLG